MKKFLAILLTLCMILSLCACASTEKNATGTTATEATTEVTTEATTEATTEETTEATTEEVTEEATEEVTEAAPAAPMTHEEYMAADMDSAVCVETYVQAHQSWWDGKITVYAQSEDGAYFLYNIACSE